MNTFRITFKRHKELKDTLAANDLSFGVYYRLMAISVVDMVVNIPMGIVYLVGDTKEIYHFHGLADLHRYISRVDRFTLEEWTSAPHKQINLEMTCWAFVGLAMLFFALGGTSPEYWRSYYNIYCFLVRKIDATSAVGTSSSPTRAPTASTSLQFAPNAAIGAHGGVSYDETSTVASMEEGIAPTIVMTEQKLGEEALGEHEVEKLTQVAIPAPHVRGVD